MARSTPGRLTVALLAAATVAGCRAAAPRDAADLTAVPAAWTVAGPGAGDTTSLLWAFRTEDCLSCMAVDYDVRRVQARFGPAVPIVALHVGSEGEAAVPEAYFRARRVRIDRTVRVSPGELRKRYPGAVLPALYLVRGRAVVWSTASRGGSRILLDTLVARVREGGDPPPRAIAVQTRR